MNFVSSLQNLEENVSIAQVVQNFFTSIYIVYGSVFVPFWQNSFANFILKFKDFSMKFKERFLILKFFEFQS